MDSLLKLHIEKSQFDHGYLLAGDFEISRQAALKMAETLLRTSGNLRTHPDFYHREFESFGIKDSQELKEKSSTRPFLGDRKVFIIEILSLTTESANALLKLFEEPPEGTHFFIIAPSADAIIPTLRSRLTVVEAESKRRYPLSTSEEEFLSALPNKRLEIIKKIGKDKNQAIEFLNGLEVILSKKTRNLLSSRTAIEGNSSESKIPGFFALEQIQKSREFLMGPAPNVKMILEHIALTLPLIV